MENAVERALILGKGEPVLSMDIPTGVGQVMPPHQVLESVKSWELDNVVSNHIIKALKKTNGKVNGKSGAARLLSINPSTLRKRMRKLGIPFGRKFKKTNYSPGVIKILHDGADGGNSFG